MEAGRRAPSPVWLVAGAVLGAVTGAALYSGSFAYFTLHSATTYDLERSWSTVRTLTAVWVVGGMATGVLVDSWLFARRGERVGGLPVLAWPFVIGILAIATFPYYVHSRTRSAAVLRAGPGGTVVPSSRPWLPAVVGVVGLLATMAVYFMLSFWSVRLVDTSSFVLTDDEQRDASAWLESAGYHAEVGCNLKQIVRIGDIFGCYAYDEAKRQTILIEGRLFPDRSVAWRIVTVEPER